MTIAPTNDIDRYATGTCRSAGAGGRPDSLHCCRWPDGLGMQADPSLGCGVTRVQSCRRGRKRRAPLTGLQRIADVHQARQRAVGSGGTLAVRCPCRLTHAFATQTRHRQRLFGRPGADARPVEQVMGGFRPGADVPMVFYTVLYRPEPEPAR
jgi:hypothetical protein